MKPPPALWPVIGLTLAGLACSAVASPTPGPYTLTLVPADAQTASAETLTAAAEVINARMADRPAWGAEASAGDGVITIRYGDPDATAEIAARATVVGAVTLVGGDAPLLPGDACPAGEPVITQADMREAQVAETAGQWQVAFTLTDAAVIRFSAYTTAHVGQVLAICRDGAVVSAPVISQPITGSEGVISGNFTRDEAEQIAAELRSGVLPIPLEVAGAGE